MDIAYFEIFLVGLFGGMHCIGMCGGVVGTDTRTKPTARPALCDNNL